MVHDAFQIMIVDPNILWSRPFQIVNPKVKLPYINVVRPVVLY
jgi:hypothetical protein